MTDDSTSADGIWRKSRASQPSGNCVEVAGGSAAVLVRDSQNYLGTVLSFSHAAWHAFLTALTGDRTREPRTRS